MAYNNKMNPASVLYLCFVVVMTVLFLPERTSSAPAPTKKVGVLGGTQNQTFSGELRKYTKSHSCLFPIPSEFESKVALFNKMDYLCQNNTSVIHESLSEDFAGPSPVSTIPIESLCIGVAQVVAKLCNANAILHLNSKTQTGDVNDLNLSINNDIDSQKSTNSVIFCDAMTKDGPSTSDLDVHIQGFYDNFLVKIKDEEISHCSTVCQNNPVANIKGDEELKINPVCLMFKKGYEILRAIEAVTSKPNVNGNTKEVIPDQGALKDTVRISTEKKDGSERPLKPISEKKSDGLKSSSSSLTSLFDAYQSPETKTDLDDDKNTAGKPEESLNTDLKKPKQDTSSSSTIVKPSSDASIDTVSGKQTPIDNSGIVGNEKGKNTDNQKSSTTSSTTPSAAGVPVSEDGEVPPPPLGAVDLKSSSPKSKTEDEQSQPAVDATNKKPSESLDKVKPDADNEGAGGEVDEYTDQIDGIPPPVSGDDNTENKIAGDKPIDTPDGDNDNMDSSSEFNDKSKKKTDSGRFQQSKLPTDDTEIGSLKFDKDRTVNINVYNNEDENGGFFNYFLFFVTFLGLCFLIFHNKRRLLAYVVEGRKPRGSRTGTRRRSSSSGASYRKLENNFDE